MDHDAQKHWLAGRSNPGGRSDGMAGHRKICILYAFLARYIHVSKQASKHSEEKHARMYTTIARSIIPRIIV